MTSLLPSRDKLPLITTCFVCVALYAVASLKYDHFFAVQNTIDLVRNYSVLAIVSVGMTFVIISGGIDLSVGAIVACGSIFIATRIQGHGDEHAGAWHPLLAYAVTVAGATALGVFSGAIVHFFDIPPFLVTLGSMFFARGLGLLISNASSAIENPLYAYKGAFYRFEHLFAARKDHFGVLISIGMVVFLALLLASAFVAAFRPIGRYVYAIGGSEQSAVLMGIPVARTRILTYAFSGFCAGVAACVFTINTTSGDPLAAGGMELDAIAAVVVGGTLLTGGVGSVLGTFVGVLIFGIIQAAITFDGRLSSWWSRIAVGILLLVFILLQKVLQPREKTSH